MFIFYSILVPFVHFFSFGQNFISFLIVVALIFNYGYTKLVYSPLLPFLFLYVTQFIIIPFHNDVPIEFQLNSFRVDFMSTILLPFAMINVMIKDRLAFPLFTKVLVTSIIIACAYSLFLTSMPGLNPYLLLVMPLSGTEFNEAYALAENTGRIYGRISGFFVHPMTNGLFLCLSIIFLFSLFLDSKDKTKKFLMILFISILFVAVFFLGVRTAIVAIGIGLSVYMLLARRFDFILYGVVVAGTLFFVLQQIPGMDAFFMSIFDSKSTDVSGSSMEMRISQLNGALDEIKSNPIFGKGYDWTGYYKNTRGDHPVLLFFESLIYVVLCNNGFLGLVIWMAMLWLYYVMIFKQFNAGYARIMLSLMTTYIIYSVVTGEYGYMKYFLIFYSIMWVYGVINHRIPRKYNKHEEKSKSHRLLPTTISSNY